MTNRTDELVTTIRVSQTTRVMLNVVKSMGGFKTLDEALLYVLCYFSEYYKATNEMEVDEVKLFGRLRKLRMHKEQRKVVWEIVKRTVAGKPEPTEPYISEDVDAYAKHCQEQAERAEEEAVLRKLEEEETAKIIKPI